MKSLALLIAGTILCTAALCQTIGSKVTFPGTDGRTYTGTITSIQSGKYYVKYDGYDFNAWLDRNQFKLFSNEEAENLIGAKITFPGTDGRTFTGTITEMQGANYKVKYDNYDYEAWITRPQFTIVDPATTNYNNTQTTQPVYTAQNNTSPASADLANIFAFGKQHGWASGVVERRFNTYVSQLSATDKSRITTLLNQANTSSARFFVLKSLAAGDRFAVAQKFIEELNQYPESYQQEHCLITTHKSIIQQWEYSCSVTVVQTYLGDLCPRYAWQLKQTADYDAVSQDPYHNAMGIQQKELLEKYGGAVSVRGDYSGKYIAINDALNALVGGILGVHYTTVQVTESLPAVFGKIRAEVDQGLNVPLLIGFVGSQARHFLLLMKYKYAQGSYQYLIYDPWDGVCDWVSESTVISGSLSPLLTQWRITLDYYYTAD